MKILFLISQLPYPLDTGAKIRSFNLIKALSKSHSITMVTFGDPEREAEKVRRLAELPVNIKLMPRRRRNPYVFALKNLFSRYPYSVDKYYSRDMSKKISALLENENFDLIHCDSVQMSRNVLKTRNIPKVLTEHNIESQILERVAENERNPLKKLYLYIQYLKLRSYEESICRRFDHIIAVSEDDKRYLAHLVPEGNISVVPNGVDCYCFQLSAFSCQLSATDLSIVFTGSMDWLPNDDAMSYFIKNTYPIIKERLSNSQVRLTIVGRDPSVALQKLALSDRSIKITGRVEDVRPYIAKGSVFIVPLRIGGGSRLKILEAMAMEKAVVSTAIGCEGLEVADKKNIIIADRPIDFANAVVSLLCDGEYRGQLGREGRKLVEERYDWKIVSDKLDKVWTGMGSMAGIPILLYHDIREDGFDVTKARPEDRPYILRKADFEKQVMWLAGNDCRVCGFADLQVYMPTRKRANRRTVLLVFDDGWESNYKIAYPILKKYGLNATFFVTVENIGRPDMMTWDELKEMADNGMEIGSHNLTHRIPLELSREELEYEMVESKRTLEGRLNRKIEFFSSPTGFYDKRIEEIGWAAGYKGVCFSKAALNEAAGSNSGFLVLNKIGIKRGFDFDTFIGIARGDKGILEKIRAKQVVRNAAKSILGARGYERVRTAVLARK